MLILPNTLDFALFRAANDIFIETGTCEGASVEKALDAGYSSIMSVEAHPPLYEKCVEKFRDEPRVELALGRSIDHLARFVQQAGNSPATIWLDAHVTSEHAAGYDDFLEKGTASEYAQQNILLQELQLILEPPSGGRGLHTILIDDINGFTEDAWELIKFINAACEGGYTFHFMDEGACRNKVLCCIPISALDLLSQSCASHEQQSTVNEQR